MYVYFLAKFRLKTVERVQLNFRLRFWSNIVQVGLKCFQTEFHPNRHRKNQSWVEFWPTWMIFDSNRGGNSTARVRPFLNVFRSKKNYCVRRKTHNKKIVLRSENVANLKHTVISFSAEMTEIRLKTIFFS
jgi:hypothetical protein